MDQVQSNQNMSPSSMGKGYGRRPLWQWISIYVVIAAVVYGAIFYFANTKKSGTVITDDGHTTVVQK